MKIAIIRVFKTNWDDHVIGKSVKISILCFGAAC